MGLLRRGREEEGGMPLGTRHAPARIWAIPFPFQLPVQEIRFENFEHLNACVGDYKTTESHSSLGHTFSSSPSPPPLLQISCVTMVYSSERPQLKIEFPETRIYEEMLNTVLFAF